MRVHVIATTGCIHLYVIVVEQQAGNILQPELTGRLQAVVTVHDRQNGAFEDISTRQSRSRKMVSARAIARLG